MPRARNNAKKAFPILVESKGRTGRIYKCADGAKYAAKLHYKGSLYQTMTASVQAAREFLEAKFAELDARAAKEESGKPLKVRVVLKDGTKITCDYRDGSELPKIIKSIQKHHSGKELMRTDGHNELLELLKDVDVSEVPEDF